MPMARMWEMPRYPITELYEPWAKDFEPGRGRADQAFMFCVACVHGGLANAIPPEQLYGQGYRTRTAASVGSKRAVENFAAFAKEHCPLDGVKTVIDIGGNDASLVNCFSGKRRVVVDPNAQGDDVEIVREFAENADLHPWKADRKIVLCSHTLEHVPNLTAFMASVGACIDPSDRFALQFPSLELLLDGCHINQIHHQHVHYFSLRSATIFLARHGFRILASRFDPDHYGALMIVAERGEPAEPPKSRIRATTVFWRRQLFDRVMHQANARIEKKGWIALGASLMLPTLVYYLPALNDVEYIADNDRSKNGLRYVNFNKQICSKYDLKGRDVVVTATSTKLACRALTAQAFKDGARNVVVPVAVL